MRRGRTAVVGAGILGLTTAYRLLLEGAEVAVFERAPDLGGLVGAFDFAGRRTDRFYHVILPTDDRVVGLATELGSATVFGSGRRRSGSTTTHGTSR